MMLAASLAWASDAAAQRGGGGGRGGGSQGGARTGGSAVSRPSGGQPATGHAMPRPAGSVHYPNGGYRPYYGYGYRGYYAPYYRYYAPYYWGAGWGWGVSFAWGYPYWGYPYYGHGYPYSPYGYPYPYYPYYFDPAVDLRIEVTPRDAEVYLDGYLVGVVDNFDGMLQRLRVPYGEHEVTIYFNGYRSISQKMLFRPGESYKIKQAMEPLPAGEQAEPRPRPTAPPPDDRGRPPVRGYGDQPYGVEPQPPMPRRGEPDMPPPGEARGNFGTLAIRVQPAGAEILIDGEPWQAPAGDDQLRVDLAEGTHRLEIRKDGYKSYSSEIRIVGGRTWPLNVSLSKSE